MNDMNIISSNEHVRPVEERDPRVAIWNVETMPYDRLLSSQSRHHHSSAIQTGGIFLLFVTVSSYAILVFLAGRRRRRVDLSQLLPTEDPDDAVAARMTGGASRMQDPYYQSELGDEFYISFFPDSQNGYDARNETFPFMEKDRRKVLGEGKTSLFKTTTPVAIHKDDDGYETDDTTEKCEIWTKYSRSNSMIRDFGDLEPIV